MSLISRVARFINGTANDGSEVDAEFQLVFDAINGGLDDSNISSGGTPIQATKVASIPPDRVLDHADDEATFNTIFPPGDTGTPLLPANLEEELERVRYRIAANKRYVTNAYYMDNTGPTATAIGWYEPVVVGPNLLPNPGFEVHSAGTPNAPDGWSLIGTPSAIAIENPAHLPAGLEKRSLRILTDAANEGISVSIAGLKTSTKYLIGMAYSITDNGTTPGTVRLTTTGGLASGDYQNLSLTDAVESSSAVTILQGIVKPTATPDPIVVRIDASESGADWNLHHVWMYELADGAPHELPSIPVQTATSSTQADYAGGSSAWAWGTDSDLSLSQYIPFRGYRLTYEVSISYTTEAFSISAGDVVTNPGNEFSVFGFRIQLDTGSGASTVAGPYIAASTDQGAAGANGGVATLKYVVDNPTPGSTYSFTTDIGCYSKGASWADCRVNPLMEAEQAVSTARLIVERL